MNNGMISDVSTEELAAVNGGLLFLAPIALALFKGVAVGAAAGGTVLVIADALNIGDVDVL